MGPRFCEECGHELHEGARFCGACGHRLHVLEASASAEPSAAEASQLPASPAAEAAPEPPPPPASPPPPSASPPPGAGGDGARRWLIGLVGALVVAIAAIAVVLFLDARDDEGSRTEREVLLESTASPGPAPFTPDLQPVSATSTTGATSTTTTTATTSPTAPPGPGRAAQGPFGGTGDNALCDRELLVSFLTDPANAAVAREWARVLDVRVQDIPAYVRSLIPTTLTADTRVTNHRWENGRAVGYQAVLERGTAVLVDTNGRLVARCRCGNPLLPPQEIAKPIYVGPRWEGFNPAVIVVVVPSPTPIYPPGGIGTIPPGTTPTTSRSTTTTWRSEPDEAIRRLKEPFEACVRSLPTLTEGYIEAGEVTEILAGLRYSATLVDQRSATYRVTVTVAQSGESASWDVNLLQGTITPVDANAQEVALNCPGLS